MRVVLQPMVTHGHPLHLVKVQGTHGLKSDAVAAAEKLNHMQYLCSIKPENPYQSHFLTFSSGMLQIYKPFLSDFVPRNASWLRLPLHASCCF